MINRIVSQETERLRRLGYDAVITAETITVSDSLVNINLNNSLMVLTDISLSAVDAVTDANVVSISSATESIEATQRNLSRMGQSIAHTFRNFLLVRTTEGEQWERKSIAPFDLHFYRITPVKTY